MSCWTWLLQHTGRSECITAQPAPCCCRVGVSQHASPPRCVQIVARYGVCQVCRLCGAATPGTQLQHQTACRGPPNRSSQPTPASHEHRDHPTHFSHSFFFVCVCVWVGGLHTLCHAGPVAGRPAAAAPHRSAAEAVGRAGAGLAHRLHLVSHLAGDQRSADAARSRSRRFHEPEHLNATLLPRVLFVPSPQARLAAELRAVGAGGQRHARALAPA